MFREQTQTHTKCANHTKCYVRFLLARQEDEQIKSKKKVAYITVTIYTLKCDCFGHVVWLKQLKFEYHRMTSLAREKKEMLAKNYVRKRLLTSDVSKQTNIGKVRDILRETFIQICSKRLMMYIRLIQIYIFAFLRPNPFTYVKFTLIYQIALGRYLR